MGGSAEFGESPDGFELLEGAAPRRGGRHREEVADVAQNLEHELVAHVGAIEVDHAAPVARGLGAVVGLAIDRLEVGEDAFAGAHEVSPGSRLKYSHPGWRSPPARSRHVFPADKADHRQPQHADSRSRYRARDTILSGSG